MFCALEKSGWQFLLELGTFHAYISACVADNVQSFFRVSVLSVSKREKLLRYK